MDNRDVLLSVRFPPDTQDQPFLELDLRDLTARPLLGRRGQLQVSTKLVFKAEEAYRQDQAVFQLWADVRVLDQRGVQMPDPGRAVVADPVFFGPDAGGGGRHDPWTRAGDSLTLGLDHRQLDEIEQKREGGSLTFTFTVGGTLHQGGRIATLYPSNHQLTYKVESSKWMQLLSQLGYGTYITVAVPLTRAGAAGLTGAAKMAANALQEAVDAFRRGDYEEAVADCRPGLEALRDADKGKFTRKPLVDLEAGWDERVSWLVRSGLSIANLAHHPNDPAASDDSDSSSPGRPNRADAEALLAVLATLIRWRTERG